MICPVVTFRLAKRLAISAACALVCLVGTRFDVQDVGLTMIVVVMIAFAELIIESMRQISGDVKGEWLFPFRSLFPLLPIK